MLDVGGIGDSDLRISGGMIDTGLLSYMDIYGQYPFNPDKKLNAEEITHASKISWTGVKIFSGAPGTGYYFPVIYAPQAFGLAMGEWLSLSVDASYRLARISTILTTIFLLFVAFRIFSPPAIVMGLLIIPMSLFQISSASLDGISNATAILGISVFARAVLEKPKAWHLWILSAAVFITASSRVHLVTMLLLVFCTFFYTKDKKSLFVGLLLTFAIAAWTVIALKTTIDSRVSLGNSPSELLMYYAEKPNDFIKTLWHTVSNIGILKNYLESFIGILGWLDTPLQDSNYRVFYILIIFTLVASVRLQASARVWGAKLLLLSSAICSILIVFFALLITWTPHPASVILGVQGRYFFVPIVMLAYSLCITDQDVSGPSYKRTFGIVLLPAIILYSAFVTTQVLLERYYLNAFSQNASRVENLKAGYHFGELVRSRTFEQSFIAKGTHVLGIRLLLATFARANHGSATLDVVDASDDVIYRNQIDLSAVKDNSWIDIRPENLELTSGKNYRLRLSTSSGTSGNAITWWASPNDSYVNGVAIVDSAKTNHDFAFTIFLN